MAVDRIHSSDIQLFIDGSRIPAVNSLSLSTPKEVIDIQRLGTAHITERVLSSNQTTTLQMEMLLTTGATGVDPFYQFQQRHGGFLTTGKFDFQVKDTAGSTVMNDASLTNYSINASVGELIRGNATYLGVGATFSDGGAISIDDQSNDDFIKGFMRPQKIQITTTTNGQEGINTESLHIQDFSISVDLPRKNVTRIGQRNPSFRYPELPAGGSIEVSMIKNSVTGLDLSSLVCDSGVIKIDLKDDLGNSLMDFVTSGCCLENVDESTSLDDNTTINFSYYFPIIQ
tara:strand:+ start:127 stop:984 length:858 start_codon:yes stop_codon:yes gene_type:complete